MALGVTQQLPVDDKHNYSTLTISHDQIAVLLGGRIAEETHEHGNVTTGAGNDFDRVTDLARKHGPRLGYERGRSGR